MPPSPAREGGFYLTEIHFPKEKGVFQKHHLPLTFWSGYSSSKEEEKIKVLIYNTFPSFSKEGCHAFMA
jgi:hypothetical protein